MSDDDEGAEALALARYEVDLARRMCEGLEGSDVRTAFAFVGPSGMVLEVAKACLTAAVDALALLLGYDETNVAPQSLERAAEAAAAWVRTFCDCRAVESYSFDPSVDPVTPL